eukprot:jgi/Hompol1/529/HPOL_002528-RA
MDANSAAASLTGRSDIEDTADYVKELLHGSGAETYLDFSKLHQQLENIKTQPSIASSILADSALSAATTPFKSILPSTTPTKRRSARSSAYQIHSSLPAIPQENEATADDASSDQAHARSHNAGGDPSDFVTRMSRDQTLFAAIQRDLQRHSTGAVSPDGRRRSSEFSSNNRLTGSTPDLRTNDPVSPTTMSSLGSSQQPQQPLSQVQADDLRQLVFSLSSEISRRSDAIQSLTQRLIQSDQLLAEVNAAHKAELSKELIKSRDAVAPLMQQLTALNQELTVTKADLDLSRSQLDAVLKQNKLDQREIDNLRFQIEETERQRQLSLQRDARMLADIRHKFGKHALQTASANAATTDGFLLEVIRAYESKISELSAQKATRVSGAAVISSSSYDHSSLQSSSFTSPNISSMASAHNERQSLSTIKSEPAATQLDTRQLELQERIKSMGSQIASLQQALNRSQNEAEALKLELATSKKAAWADEAARQEGKQHFEREICIKLSIRQLDQLPSSVDRIFAVLQLMKQMETFIREVEVLVRLHPSMTQDDSQQNSTPRKLPQTLQVIRSWAENAEDYRYLKDFCETVHRLFGIEQRFGSDSMCIQELRLLLSSQPRRQTQARSFMLEDAAEILAHFCSLFEVPTPTGAVSRMEEVYVFWTSVRELLGPLRQALHLDRNVQPAAVLKHAVDTINSTTSLHSKMHEVIETSRSI